MHCRFDNVLLTMTDPTHGGYDVSETQPVIRVLIHETNELNDRFVTVSERASKSAGLSKARWQVLRAIAHRPLTVAQISRRLGLTRQAVQRTADLLVESSLTEYLENPDHRRAQLLSLSPSGQLALEVAERAHEQWTTRLATLVDRQDVDSAVQLMRSVRSELDRLDRELRLPD